MELLRKYFQTILVSSCGLKNFMEEVIVIVSPTATIQEHFPNEGGKAALLPCHEMSVERAGKEKQ